MILFYINVLLKIRLPPIFTRTDPLLSYPTFFRSDHGQTLHERGDAGTTTHCSPAPAPEEGTVRLVVIGGDDAWAAAARRRFDATSHYRNFPTLLAALGYDRGAVRRLYGPGLDAQESEPPTFNAQKGREHV